MNVSVLNILGKKEEAIVKYLVFRDPSTHPILGLVFSWLRIAP